MVLVESETLAEQQQGHVADCPMSRLSAHDTVPPGTAIGHDITLRSRDAMKGRQQTDSVVRMGPRTRQNCYTTDAKIDSKSEETREQRMNNERLRRRELYRLLAIGLAVLGVLAGSVSAAENKPSQKLGKVLMPIGDATEAMDTLYPFFRLAEEGYEVVVAGPEARRYHMVLHEVPPNSDVPWDITREMPGYHIQAVVAFRDVKPEEYVGLFLSGGRAPEYLRYDKDLMRITKHFVKREQAHRGRLSRHRDHRGGGRPAGRPAGHDRGKMRTGHHADRRRVRQRAVRRRRQPGQRRHVAQLRHAVLQDLRPEDAGVGGTVDVVFSDG